MVKKWGWFRISNCLPRALVSNKSLIIINSLVFMIVSLDSLGLSRLQINKINNFWKGYSEITYHTQRT